MRIAFYCPQAAALFDPASGIPHGGAEIDIFYLSRWLARNGWDVHVLVARWGDQDGSPVAGPDGVTLHPFYRPGRLGNLLRVPRRMGRVLRAIAPDVVLQEAAGAETGLLARWCRRNGARFVYRVAHDIDCTGEYLRWSPLRGRLYRRGLLSADRVIALTPRQQGLLAEHFSIDAAVVPYAHPAPDGPPRSHAERRHVLWIGRFQAWKRPELVLDLARDLPDVAFRLVGRTDGETGERIQRDALELPHVSVPGPVPFFETAAEFEHAIALVNTSRYEGYPHAFLQALRAGTPLVSLDVDPDGSLAAGGFATLAGGDLGRMRDAIARLASDPAHFDAAAQAAQQHFSAHHALDVVGPQLAAILEALA